MAITPFDSALYHKLFADAEIAKLFTESAELRAMLVVEGTLAKAQAKLGMIPQEAAEAIYRDGMELVVDPRALADATAQNGVPVPALLARFRADMHRADAAQYVHWGATTQDIIDTGLALRMRRVLARFQELLTTLVDRLANLAKSHRDTAMAGRTWGMAATPTSFGAVVAGWGGPFLRHQTRLSEGRETWLQVSLSGAAGTLSAMGVDGPEVRAELAKGLGLSDPGGTWHSTRDNMAALSAWCCLVTGSLGKMGEDVLSLVRCAEVTLGGGGGSSTMPQKQNPVAPSVLVALSRQVIGLNANMQGAMLHKDQRDGAAWMVEWMSLPQICMATARALEIAAEIAAQITPNEDIMAQGIKGGHGLIFAESLSFHLARHMPRPDAQAAVKELCLEARALDSSLSTVAARRWPELDLGPAFDLHSQLGDAPSEADRFVAEAIKL